MRTVSLANLGQKMEAELVEALKVHGVSKVEEMYPTVKLSTLNVLRERHGIARKPSGPAKLTPAEITAKFSAAERRKLKACRTVAEGIRALGLTSAAGHRVKIAMEHLGVSTGQAGRSPEAVARKHSYDSVAKLAEAMVLMNNTEAGIKLGMSKKAAAILRAELGLPLAKNGRSFRKPIIDAPKPSAANMRIIVTAHSEMGSNDAREWLCSQGMNREMVNRALTELDAANALTPLDHIAQLSPRELKVLQDPFLNATQAASRIKSVSVKRVVALRSALGVRKDALGRVMKETGKTPEQIRSLIEFEGLEDAARLINVPSKVVVEVRKSLGLQERPYQSRLELRKAMPSIYKRTGTKTLAGLKRKIKGMSLKDMMEEFDLPLAQVELLITDVGLGQNARQSKA